MDRLDDISAALPTSAAKTATTTTTATTTVHVEIEQRSESCVKPALVEMNVKEYLIDKRLRLGDVICDFPAVPFLMKHVARIRVCAPEDADTAKEMPWIDSSTCTLELHAYQLNNEGASAEEIEEDELSAASHWLLPATEFDGIWENLIFDVDVKEQLLRYAETTLLFSKRGVDANVVAWNRVVLLHGPPGTGKTSLCRALAQKLTIRLNSSFRRGQLIEINSHSLFSKWFSESGKLVQKMFQRIQELIDDEDSLVFVLIDEVESLTAARTSAMNGAEPSDAIRVVNALLTQVDQIKRCPNVIILTTSNITGAIDLAFVDRADIKQYIGPPSPRAIFTIYRDCLVELVKKQVITVDASTAADPSALVRRIETTTAADGTSLTRISQKSYGLSGRTLRKIPFLAHALFIRAPVVTMETFLTALSLAVDKQLDDRDKLCAENDKQKSLGQARRGKDKPDLASPMRNERNRDEDSDLSPLMYRGGDTSRDYDEEVDYVESEVMEEVVENGVDH